MLSRVPRLIRRQPLPTSLLFLPSSRFTHSSSMTPAFHLTLTPEEERLTTLLVECAEWIDENPHEVDALRVQDSKGSWVGMLMGKEKVQLRVAGGWVRDKVSARAVGGTSSSQHPRGVLLLGEC
jgi:type II secretory pathway component PulL